jgi:hypothetical protein
MSYKTSLKSLRFSLTTNWDTQNFKINTATWYLDSHIKSYFNGILTDLFRSSRVKRNKKLNLVFIIPAVLGFCDLIYVSNTLIINQNIFLDLKEVPLTYINQLNIRLYKACIFLTFLLNRKIILNLINYQFFSIISQWFLKGDRLKICQILYPTVKNKGIIQQNFLLEKKKNFFLKKVKIFIKAFTTKQLFKNNKFIFLKIKNTKSLIIIKRRLKAVIKNMVYEYYKNNAKYFFETSNLELNLSDSFSFLTDIDDSEFNFLVTKCLKLYNRYRNIENYFFKFRKNRFFMRILPIMFSNFFATTPDLIMLTNALAYEFKILRKRHSYFISFLQQIIHYMLVKYQEHTTILGLRLTIKGRITFGTRQTRRKQKKIIYIGKLNGGLIESSIDTASSLAISRFGTINIKLEVRKRILIESF